MGNLTLNPTLLGQKGRRSNFSCTYTPFDNIFHFCKLPKISPNVDPYRNQFLSGIPPNTHCSRSFGALGSRITVTHKLTSNWIYTIVFVTVMNEHQTLSAKQTPHPIYWTYFVEEFGKWSTASRFERKILTLQKKVDLQARELYRGIWNRKYYFIFNLS